MKVMDDEPIILLLYMDDLFLTRNEKHITYCKKKLAEEFKMKRYWIGALFPQSESMAKLKSSLFQSGKLCGGNFEKI